MSMTRLNLGTLLLTLLALTGCAVPTIPYVHPEPKNARITAIIKDTKITYLGSETGLTDIQRHQLMYFLKQQPVAEIHLQDCFANEDQHSYNNRVQVLRRYLLSRGYKKILIKPPRAPASRECPCIYMSVVTIDFNHSECEQLPYYAPTADPFSCATTKNLYNMMSDKRDLNTHKEFDSYDGQVLSGAINQYRNSTADGVRAR